MDNCDLCGNIYKNKYYYILHALWECTTLLIVFIQYIIWSTYILKFKFSNKTKYPCNSCKHACWLHLADLAEDKMGTFTFSGTYLLFKFKFLPKIPLEQILCLHCMLVCFDPRQKGIELDLSVDHKYEPMDNLSYLEMKAYKE